MTKFIPLNTTYSSFAEDSIKEINKVNVMNYDTISTNSFPVVLSPTIYNPKTSSSYIGYNPSYPNIITSGFYDDLNKDKSVHKTLSKFYFYKILDKWIYKELLPLLAFVDISNKPQLIKSMDKFNIKNLETNSDIDIQKKINYLEKNIITIDIVKHVLKKICNDNNINWYDLNKYEKKIKKVFYNYLFDKLKHSIKHYGHDKHHDKYNNIENNEE